ncbi:MAG: extracellular solute-binding protein [bacterium]|nr:extracellular solute-binding protein [bacterium]
MKITGKQAVFVPMMAAAILLLVITGTALVWSGEKNSKTVLRFGMSAGSYWEVPTGNCYEVIDAAIQRFEAKHPDVKVEYVSGILKTDYSEWLAEQIVLGEEPDVFMIPEGEFDMIASLHVLKNLDLLIERDSGFESAAYYKGAYLYGNIRGVQYALPYESVPTLMFVNKTLLDKEGIPMPKESWTWDDFLALCQQVTRDTDGDGIIDQFGCFDFDWKEAVCSNGAVLFEENGTVSYFGDSKVETAVKFVKELNAVNQGYIVTAKEFDRGKVAFRPFAFSEYRTYKPYPWRIKKYSDFEWDCINLPSGPDGSGQSQLNTLLMGISSRTKQESLAWEFLKELCYEEETQVHILEASQGMPVLRKAAESSVLQSVLGDDVPGSGQMNVQVIQQVMEDAVDMPNFQLYAAAMELADGEISHMVNGDMALDNRLLKLQREINSLLKQ